MTPKKPTYSYKYLMQNAAATLREQRRGRGLRQGITQFSKEQLGNIILGKKVRELQYQVQNGDIGATKAVNLLCNRFGLNLDTEQKSKLKDILTGEISLSNANREAFEKEPRHRRNTRGR